MAEGSGPRVPWVAKAIYYCYENKIREDLVFLCDDLRVVYAHKAVFAAASPFLEALIKALPDVGIPYISLPGVHLETMVNVIYYVYGHSKLISRDDLFRLNEVLKMLSIPMIFVPRGSQPPDENRELFFFQKEVHTPPESSNTPPETNNTKLSSRKRNGCEATSAANKMNFGAGSDVPVHREPRPRNSSPRPDMKKDIMKIPVGKLRKKTQRNKKDLPIPNAPEIIASMAGNFMKNKTIKNKKRKRTDLEEDNVSSKRRRIIADADNSRNTSSSEVVNPQKSSRRFTEKQKQCLMIAYNKNDYLDAASCSKLAEELGMSEKSVRNWFTRTRSKARQGGKNVRPTRVKTATSKCKKLSAEKIEEVEKVYSAISYPTTRLRQHQRAEEMQVPEDCVVEWNTKKCAETKPGIFPQSSEKSGKPNVRHKKHNKTPRDLPLLCECNDMKKAPLKRGQMVVLTQQSDTPSVITESPEKANGLDENITEHEEAGSTAERCDMHFQDGIMEEERKEHETGSGPLHVLSMEKHDDATAAEAGAGSSRVMQGSSGFVTKGSVKMCYRIKKNGKKKYFKPEASPTAEKTFKYNAAGAGSSRVMQGSSGFVTKGSVKMCYRIKKNGKKKYFKPEASPTAEKTFKYNAGSRPVKDSKRKGLKAFCTDISQTKQRMKKLEVHHKKNTNPSRAEISTIADEPKTREKSEYNYKRRLFQVESNKTKSVVLGRNKTTSKICNMDVIQLKKHMGSHLGDPYCCAHCGARFASLLKIRCHMKNCVHMQLMC